MHNSHDYYLEGNYSLNSSKDLLFIIYDKYRFNLTFQPSNDNMFFRAYANSSYGNISSSLIIASFDFDVGEDVRY